VGKVLLNVGNITHELHCRPGFDLGSNRSEYQGYLLGCEGGRYVGLKNLPPSCADCPEILEACFSWSPKGLSRSVLGQLYILIKNLVSEEPCRPPGFSEEENTTRSYVWQ
jgi:hypothetical protein